MTQKNSPHIPNKKTFKISFKLYKLKEQKKNITEAALKYKLFFNQK